MQIPIQAAAFELRDTVAVSLARSSLALPVPLTRTAQRIHSASFSPIQSDMDEVVLNEAEGAAKVVLEADAEFARPRAAITGATAPPVDHIESGTRDHLFVQICCESLQPPANHLLLPTSHHGGRPAQTAKSIKPSPSSRLPTPAHLTLTMGWSVVVKYVLAGVGLPVAWALWSFRSFMRTFWTTRLRNLPGPKSESLLSGNLGRMFKAENSGG